MPGRAEFADNLKQALRENQLVVVELESDGWPLVELQFLQTFQQQRMARDYRDFLAQPDFAPALEFFLTELYGGLGFIERNHDLEKVYSIMVRMLPVSLLAALAEAMKFQALSIRLDMDITQQLISSGVNVELLSLRQYSGANQQLGAESRKRLQVEGIIHLGNALRKEVSRPFTLQLLKIMRLPAKVAGFAKLHDFLEKGLSAFLGMPDIEEFLESLEQREAEFLDGIFDPKEAP